MPDFESFAAARTPSSATSPDAPPAAAAIFPVPRTVATVTSVATPTVVVTVFPATVSTVQPVKIGATIPNAQNRYTDTGGGGAGFAIGRMPARAPQRGKRTRSAAGLDRQHEGFPPKLH